MGFLDELKRKIGTEIAERTSINKDKPLYSLKRKNLKNSDVFFYEDRFEENYLNKVIFYKDMSSVMFEEQTKQVVFMFVYKGKRYTEGWFDKKDIKNIQNAMSLISDYQNIKKKEFEEKNTTTVERLKHFVIDAPTVSLKPEEVCFYEGTATAYHIKNVVVGKTSSGASASFRIAKGVSVRTGGNGSKNIRGDIEEKFEGTLYITNMRIVLLTAKYGFDLQRSKINKFEVKSDGFVLYAGSKSYTVLTDDMEKINYILDLINKGQVEQVENKTKNIDSYEEIKKLKELLDLGIISQDEFDQKKRQLLGL